MSGYSSTSAMPLGLVFSSSILSSFFFQAEDGIRDRDDGREEGPLKSGSVTAHRRIQVQWEVGSGWSARRKVLGGGGLQGRPHGRVRNSRSLPPAPLPSALRRVQLSEEERPQRFVRYDLA